MDSEDYDSLLERLMSVASFGKVQVLCSFLFLSYQPYPFKYFRISCSGKNHPYIPCLRLPFLCPTPERFFFSLSSSRSRERWFSQLHPLLSPSFLLWPPTQADFGEEACFKTRRNDVCFIPLTPCLLLLAECLSHMPWTVPS